MLLNMARFGGLQAGEGGALRTGCYRLRPVARQAPPQLRISTHPQMLSTASVYEHKARTYLHFDSPISSSRAQCLVQDPEAVAKHSFYPFLGFTLSSPRVERAEDGQVQARDPKDRPIKIAAHADAAIYAHYSSILREPYQAALSEKGLESAVTAFRKFPERGRNNVWFANEVFEFIESHRPCSAICMDITKFFDRLNHDHLKAAWAGLLGEARLPADHFSLFKNLTKFTWVKRDEVYAQFGISRHNPRPRDLNRTRICSSEDFRSRVRGSGLLKFNPRYKQKQGIPQGSPMSALLSNIYMLTFDEAMTCLVSELGGLYRRYCDDLIIVVPPESEEAALNFARSEIEKLKLEIHPDKTHTVRFPAGSGTLTENGELLQYLGFTFDGTRKLIRNSSITRYYAKMRRAVRLTKSTQRKHNRREKNAGHRQTPLKKRKLYKRYSYLTHRRAQSSSGQKSPYSGNFLTYAYTASRRMGSPAIKVQVQNHWKKLQREIKG